MAGKLDSLERVEVTNRAQWRAWLKKHHRRSEGIWLVTWKKATPAKHVGWDAVVEEALCFGWIDSLPRKLDERRTMLYVSPRKPKSVWSRMNKERIARLEAAGRMAEAGQKAIETAKANGSWTAIDAAEAMDIPADLLGALLSNKKALKHYDAFPQGARRQIISWVLGAKTDATRARRIATVVNLAAQNVRANGQTTKRTP